MEKNYQLFPKEPAPPPGISGTRLNAIVSFVNALGLSRSFIPIPGLFRKPIRAEAFNIGRGIGIEQRLDHQFANPAGTGNAMRIATAGHDKSRHARAFTDDEPAIRGKGRPAFADDISFHPLQTWKQDVVGKGWPTFTPDGRFIIGESSRVPGFVMAGGCNAHGISGSGGIGKLMVESLLDPNPSPYVKSLSPDRFTEKAWNWDEASRQAQGIYETYYGV